MQASELPAFAKFGAPLGRPVLVQHGMIASIREDGLFIRLVCGGRRVISIARPEYGLRCRDWGFALSRVTCPVRMRHSRRDEAVPWTCAERTAALLSDCRLDLRENDPHFSAAILDEFLADM